MNMNVYRIASIVAFSLAASSAFAASPVEQYGRTAATAGNGATATIVAGCGECHVSEVQGRAALNHVPSIRPSASGRVVVRNNSVESFGRA
jgi:hypothetical protein